MITIKNNDLLLIGHTIKAKIHYQIEEKFVDISSVLWLDIWRKIGASTRNASNIASNNVRINILSL